MFEIDTVTKQISVTRGDTCSIPIKIRIGEEQYYTFKIGDIVSFSIYDRKGYDKDPYLLKEINVEEETEVVYINLSTIDTRFGDVINKPKEYWYEIELNNNQTVLGYDDKGPKIFMLYPEGGEN